MTPKVETSLLQIKNRIEDFADHESYKELLDQANGVGSGKFAYRTQFAEIYTQLSELLDDLEAEEIKEEDEEKEENDDE